MTIAKPLGIKNYGSIPHLPGSRIGPGDHHCHEGQSIICTETVRDKYDLVWVTEKVDGSNVGIAKIDGELFALGRAGYLAQTSKFEQHQIFAHWVRENAVTLSPYIQEGERLVGEWMCQAHGTRYTVTEPFIVFDIMSGVIRLPFVQVIERCDRANLPHVYVIHCGPPLSISSAMDLVEPSHHGSLDPVEGCVWRVERKGAFDFMAKYVRPDKQDGYYLPEVSGKEVIWNWKAK